MTALYPEIKPYNSFRLQVSELHNLYVEESGNPLGQPVLFLHGGPGAGSKAKHRRYFSPEKYRIIIFDQRGAGQSTPYAELKENTTWDLISDIEKIREHLAIENWLVFGGSWGSTLALAYAQTHTERVTGLILRGIFLCRPEEINWFYQEGCSWLFPERWEIYQAPVAANQRHNMLKAYYELLTSDNQEIRFKAAKAWSTWEGSTIKLIPEENLIAEFEALDLALSMARIECHYFMNNCFFETNNFLLENAHKLSHIPISIIHGRYDVICPAKNAWDLHKALPHSKLQIISDAGHSAEETGIIEALVNASDEFVDYN